MQANETHNRDTKSWGWYKTLLKSKNTKKEWQELKETSSQTYIIFLIRSRASQSYAKSLSFCLYYFLTWAPWNVTLALLAIGIKQETSLSQWSSPSFNFSWFRTRHKSNIWGGLVTSDLSWGQRKLIDFCVMDIECQTHKYKNVHNMFRIEQQKLSL